MRLSNAIACLDLDEDCLVQRLQNCLLGGKTSRNGTRIEFLTDQTIEKVMVSRDMDALVLWVPTGLLSHALEVAESQGPLPTFTVFCRQTNNQGTTYISGGISAEDANEAARLGREECAAEWDMPEEVIHVLGVFRGDMAPVLWEDISQ